MEEREQVLSNLSVIQKLICAIQNDLSSQLKIERSKQDKAAHVSSGDIAEKYFEWFFDFSLKIWSPLHRFFLSKIIIAINSVLILIAIGTRSSGLIKFELFYLGMVAALVLHDKAYDAFYDGSGRKKTVAAIIVILSTVTFIAPFLALFQYLYVIYAYAFALILIALICVIQLIKNKKIDGYNEVVVQNNAQKQDRINAIALREQDYVNQLSDCIEGWYPEEFCNIFSVNYIIQLIKNHEADSLKEAYKLLREELRHREIMSGINQANETLLRMEDQARMQNQKLDLIVQSQAEQKRLLQYGNMINAANMMISMSNASQLQNMNQNIQSLDQNLQSANGDLSRIANANEGAARSLNELNNRHERLTRNM